MVMLPRTRIYKILSQYDWSISEPLGISKTPLDDMDGYVHLSTREQVAETLRLHYAGEENVRLLEYIVEEMSGPIRWEESRGGQFFPHLYAHLRLADAKRSWILVSGADGVPVLPANIDA
ncbi:MAG: DUF952 domain-containing protein [Pseudomonadota bacterium]